MGNNPMVKGVSVKNVLLGMQEQVVIVKCVILVTNPMLRGTRVKIALRDIQG
jgi:hypothetical protein